MQALATERERDNFEVIQLIELAKVFASVDGLLKAHADLLSSVMKKFDKIDVAFIGFIQKTVAPFSFDEIKLFLMEEACSALKKDPVAMDWKKLKNSSHKNFLWLDKNAEPWLSLNIENPGKNAYLYFFEHRHEYRSIRMTQKMQAIFSEKLKIFLDKTEGIYVDPM
jgi:hypothetical protein